MARGISRSSYLVFFLGLRLIANAQAPAAKEPDTMILSDGEKLIGHLERATADKVTFKSDVIGEVSVEWAKVKELHSSDKFALVPKNANLNRLRTPPSSIPVGIVALADQKVEMSQTPSAAPPPPTPVANIADLVPQSEYEKAFQHTPFVRGWKGGATGGISLTEATQKNQTLTGTVNLVRATPDVTWLDTRTRTLINFNSAYSKLTQPGTPDLKTSLVHFDGEQDWYLSPRLFAFVSAALDHSFSQGMRLQQNYGVGVGYVLLKNAVSELDVKASANYIDQRREDDTSSSLIGTTFGETYTRKFVHGIVLNEQATFTPSWNDTSAYTMIGSAGITFPVYHRFGLTIGTLDNYINNPPAGFEKNSYQLTVGATYAFQ